MKIYSENNEPIPAIQVLSDSDTVPLNFTEITTITNLHKYGMKNGYDYKAVRSQIQIVATTVGFTNLSLTEKKLASKWFAVLKEDRDTVHSIEEQIVNGKEFYQQSVISRQNRLDRIISEVYTRLSTIEINELIDDTLDISVYYVSRGREGTVEGDPEGLYDYIESRTGTTWDSVGSSPGLKSKGWLPYGKTLNTLVIDLISILRNGFIE